MNTSAWKRGLAALLVAVMGFIGLAQPIYHSRSLAASSKTEVSYIAETKLFIKKEGSVADAKAWCESQGNGWKVVEGDLNAGASGAMTKEQGVFLCYRTTNDPNEAITDLAVMNERGNYSEGEYERLLKEQKEQYIDIVKNMRLMIDEYKKNYNNNVPVAVKAHDFMNLYKEDDSGQLLGDLLLTVNEDKLAEILLQANGLVVLTIQQQLASACDIAKTTWLDRLSKLGSYDMLKNAFSKNMSAGNIKKTLDKQYRDTAELILENWGDISDRFAEFDKFRKKYSLENASLPEILRWVSDKSIESEEFADYQEVVTLISLIGYDYGKDDTLLSLFSKTADEIKREGIEVLYPMAACLSKGQIAALKESVGIYNLIQNAYGANIYNDYDTGMAATLSKMSSAEDKKAIFDFTNVIKNFVKNINNGGKISVYEGVDRDVFGGGVAVTTTAKRYSNGVTNPWTNAFFKNGAPARLSIAMGVGAATLSCTAIGFAVAQKFTEKSVAKLLDKKTANLFGRILDTVDNASGGGEAVQSAVAKLNEEFGSKTVNFIRINYGQTADRIEGFRLFKVVANEKEFYNQDVQYAFNRLKENVSKDADFIRKVEAARTRFNIYDGLKWGATIFTIVLAATDIVLTSIAMYDYYHVDHIAIPHHMVDISYSENEEAAYIAYKSVRDQDGKPGDLNAGSSRQWLALYCTKDAKAGSPIVAPGNGSEIIVKTGDSQAPEVGYTPLHMFGTPNVVQNLTFADGDSGYSYNDKNHGTYLFFMHADKQINYSDPMVNDEDAGTVISTGVIALISVVSLVAGVFIGAVTTNVRRRRHFSNRRIGQKK